MVTQEVHKWASEGDTALLPDPDLGEQTPEYDNFNCGVIQMCKAKALWTLSVPWPDLLKSLAALLHIIKQYALESLNQALVLFRMQSVSRPGPGGGDVEVAFTHIVWCAAESDPKLKALGIRCKLAPWEDTTADIPTPPYDLRIKFANKHFGPDTSDWQICMWDFVWLSDLAKEEADKLALQHKVALELDWTILIRDNTFVLRVHGEKAPMCWWDCGPQYAQADRASSKKSQSDAKADLAALRKPPKARKTGSRRSSPAPVADKKKRRKYTEQERLEMQLFGVCLDDKGASAIPPVPGTPGAVEGPGEIPEDPGAVPEGLPEDKVCDSPISLLDLFGDDAADSDAGGGAGGLGAGDHSDGDADSNGSEDPDPIDYTPGPDGFISHAAALSLMMPEHSGGFHNVVSPEDGVTAIGQLQPQWHLPSGPYAMSCKLHPKCSRMRMCGPHEPLNTEKVVLIRWLVAGLQFKPQTDENKKKHMAVTRGCSDGQRREERWTRQGQGRLTTSTRSWSIFAPTEAFAAGSRTTTTTVRWNGRTLDDDGITTAVGTRRPWCCLHHCV